MNQNTMVSIWGKLNIVEELQIKVKIYSRKNFNSHLSCNIHKTTSLKHSCPLSPTLFGLHINELEKLITNTLGQKWIIYYMVPLSPFNYLQIALLYWLIHQLGCNVILLILWVHFLIYIVLKLILKRLKSSHLIWKIIMLPKSILISKVNLLR